MKIQLLKAYTKARFPKFYVQLGSAKRKSHTLIHKAKSYARSRLDAWKQHELDAKHGINPVLRDALNKLGGLKKFEHAAYQRSDALSAVCDPKHIVMLVVSALRIDPRVEREARALAKAGYCVTVICPDISSPPLHEVPINWGEGIEFDILGWQAASFLNRYPFIDADQMLDAALKYKPLAFHCHDLSTALAGLAAARQVGCACVCDFHEWFSENVTWDAANEKYILHPESTRQIYQAAELLVMARADEVITVCDSIADELKINYRNNRKIHILRNIPSLINICEEKFPSLRDQLKIDSQKIIALYQGGTGPTRNLEPTIQALAHAPNVVLVIRGPSLEYFGEGYINVAKSAGVENRVFLLPPVKSFEVVSAANGADIGIYTVLDLGKNFHYALPNKIFEYLAAGVPLVCANYPEVEIIIKKYNVGITFDPYDQISTANAYKACTPENLEIWRNNIPHALRKLAAGSEWDRLVILYDNLREKLTSK